MECARICMGGVLAVHLFENSSMTSCPTSSPSIRCIASLDSMRPLVSANPPGWRSQGVGWREKDGERKERRGYREEGVEEERDVSLMRSIRQSETFYQHGGSRRGKGGQPMGDKAHLDV